MSDFAEGNFCQYGLNWQPYKDDYDKFEYDIKLKDGTIVENCYPNAGKFNSITKPHDGKSYYGSDVLEIRFTPKDRQKFCINPDEMYKSI